MSFGLLALVVAVGLLGPLLAARTSWHVPVALGELAGGLAIGVSGLRLVDPAASDFHLLANIGFGLTMVVVGSHIPVRDGGTRAALARGGLGAVLTGVAAAILGVVIATAFQTGHAAVYAVLLASSSAALVLPMLESVGPVTRPVTQLVAQIAIADIACIVALPLVLQPAAAGEAALVTLAIAMLAAILALVIIRLDRSGLRHRMHAYSERRRFALELRFSLLALFALAAVAQYARLSIMMAGFALGLVLATAGEPRRLAGQLFGMTDGFFGPLFIVWLGASLDLRALAGHPEMILLGVALGLGAAAAHLAARLAGLPWGQSLASAGQLGVPVAAVALGIQAHVFQPGEDGAIILSALVTVVASALAVVAMARGPHRRAGRRPGRTRRA